MTADEKFPVKIKGDPQIRNESTDVLKTKVELPIDTAANLGTVLEANDVGSAVLFYEFCHTFGEVLMASKQQG
jgi:hypothetical protein